MYQNEDFKPVGEVSAGELVLKLPGTNLKMLYSSGTGYVNGSNNVAHLQLVLAGMVAEESGEPAEGMAGTLGEMLREQISAPGGQRLIQETMVGNNLHLFYSRVRDGKSILALPGLSEKDMVDSENHPEFTVLSYNTRSDSLGYVDAVYGFHSRVAADFELVADRAELEREVLTLADKANGVYDLGLRLMRESGI